MVEGFPPSAMISQHWLLDKYTIIFQITLFLVGEVPWFWSLHVINTHPFKRHSSSYGHFTRPCTGPENSEGLSFQVKWFHELLEELDSVRLGAESFVCLGFH